MSRLRTLLLVLITIAVATAACGEKPSTPASTRTLAEFQPHLTAKLTPAIAIATFGAPDSETRSDKWLFVYRLADRRRLLLSFPGEAPIIFARVEDSGGLSTELPLRQ